MIDFEQLKRRIPHWGRVVMNRDIAAFLDGLPTASMRAVEVSGWAHESRTWQSYRATMIETFDICTTERVEPEADIVFCEQVLEHVVDPIQAARNLFNLLHPGGYAVVSVPFMVRIHKEPEDYWRFSQAGLRVLLERAGFEVERTDDWGNRLVVLANLWRWCPYVPFVQPMWRSRATPLVVWAIARKEGESS